METRLLVFLYFDNPITISNVIASYKVHFMTQELFKKTFEVNDIWMNKMGIKDFGRAAICLLTIKIDNELDITSMESTNNKRTPPRRSLCLFYLKHS